ncbi:MAG: serine hydroxymethyltransferase [candidate division SR1 bacterium]|nr:serine hydroxymethyltransferase [candidate division SR1 bacterium]
MNHLSTLTKQEFNRQKNTLNLIASENYPSPKVLELLGSVWSNKYGEGYPGKRYYAGNENTDEMEKYVQDLALRVFDKTDSYGVNVQVLSGSPANSTVYLAMLSSGDTIMSLNLANGGHLSHLHETSNYNKFFKHVTYDVVNIGDNTFEIDIENFKNTLETYKPKLVIVGFSAYPRGYKFSEMCKLAHKSGSLVLADIAHINGLVAAGLHDSPFGEGDEFADFVSMTTHKTLRGPRGALLFAKKEYITDINKTIFPGTNGGPHFHQIAATGQCLLEILGEDKYPDNIDFITYSKLVLSTCKEFENTLKGRGLEIISSTQTHLALVKLPSDSDSIVFQQKLERVGIISNRNMIPFDTKSAWRPSGMRFGTAALTSRGLDINGAKKIANMIVDTLFDTKDESTITKEVLELAQSLNWWY